MLVRIESKKEKINGSREREMFQIIIMIIIYCFGLYDSNKTKQKRTVLKMIESFRLFCSRIMITDWLENYPLFIVIYVCLISHRICISRIVQ